MHMKAWFTVNNKDKMLMVLLLCKKNLGKSLLMHCGTLQICNAEPLLAICLALGAYLSTLKVNNDTADLP